METIIAINNLGKRYARSPGWALKDISLTIHSGEVFGLVGENGAGKTTFIRLLLGLIRPTTGQVKFSHSPGIGYVPDRPVFYTTFTVTEYLNLLGQLTGLKGKRLKDRVDHALHLVNLADRAGSRIGTLSRGMLQRLGIAQAILGDPEIIIMDEPAAGLDPFGQKGIRDIILRLHQQGKTILFSSHYLAEIERVCSRVGVLHKGRLVLNRGIGELMRERRQMVAIEIDAEAIVLEEALSRLELDCELEGHRIIFHHLDDDRYFAVMQLLGERRIRVLSLSHPGLFLEDVFLTATNHLERGRSR
ncbi:MAG TPA: ABC transporter ATP-binding protein [Desulfotomaculum sp.]|nr:ABC transporter ATP-binding protein [Desulfotomaculum sp.]